ncbi:MAG: thiol reductant ABC exporter subunit CydD [Methylococcales bacterium]|nr:thiol reductant ABC exporter subunit CydD [Methylococcales bacterium]
MPLTESDNQQYFDKSKLREKAGGDWLRMHGKTVRKQTFLAAMAGIINGLGVIVQAWLFAFILQAVIIEHIALPLLIMPFVIVIGVFLLRSGCVYAQQICGFEAGAQVRAQVRQALADKCLKLRPAYFKQRQSGELAAVTLEQVDALELYFTRYCPQQIIVGVLPVIMIAVVMPINWVVGLIFLCTGPLVPVFMALIGMGAAAANRNQFLVMTRMNGYFLDRLQGLSTLKLFGQASRELDTINRVADDFREKTMQVLRIAFLSSAVLEFFSAVAVALVAVYVGLGLLGRIQIGPANGVQFKEALFVLLLAPEFFMPLRQLAAFYHDRAAALGAADAILAILEQDEAQFKPCRDVPRSIIAFHNVSKRYGKRDVLTTINVEIHVGEKIALVGASGAGKTTLFNLLLGFEVSTEGTVFLNGTAINPTLAAQSIAWVGQNAYIFQGSIRDNIALADPHASEQRISNAANAAGVTEFSAQLADGLLTLIGERGFGLSGGQIQRIALARAFLKHADIILLDEPTANLDASNKHKLLDVIDELFKAKTLIIASHDDAVIRRMDRKILLHHGRVQL